MLQDMETFILKKLLQSRCSFRSHLGGDYRNFVVHIMNDLCVRMKSCEGLRGRFLRKNVT